MPWHESSGESMRQRSSGLGYQQLSPELFVMVNLGFLSLDIYLAHSVNLFRRPAEYVPLIFSVVAPLVLALGVALKEGLGSEAVWRDLGHLVGWLAIVIGALG